MQTSEVYLTTEISFFLIYPLESKKHSKEKLSIYYK